MLKNYPVRSYTIKKIGIFIKKYITNLVKYEHTTEFDFRNAL